MKKLFKKILVTLLLINLSPICTIAANDENLNKFPNEEVVIERETIGKKGNDFFIVKDLNGKILFLSKVTDDDLYAAAALNVRIIPTTESTPARTIEINTPVKRVGKSYCGWDIILEDEEYYFVWSEYLTDTPVELPIVEEYDYSYDYQEPVSYAYYSPSEFRVLGVIYWGNWRWTWYSERVLPGGGLHIPGRYTDSLGYVRDEYGYLCLASEALPWGTVVDTPFGSPGRVYDNGCDYDVLDVYVGW